MNTTENWFFQHKEQLQNEEPENGHFERFAQKLQQKHTAHKTNRFRAFYLYASAAAVVLLISVSVVFSTNKLTGQTEPGLANVSAEYKEVDSYYSNKIDAQLQQIKKLECTNSKEEIKNLDTELKDLDESYLKLAKELAKNQNNEQIIEAMILNLKTKAELVGLILEKLQHNC